MISGSQISEPSIGLPPEQFAEVFPFHLAVDRNLTLVQVGRTLQRMCPDAAPGAGLARVFRALQPEGEWSFEWLIQNQHELFVLAHLISGLRLRGEFVEMPDKAILLFLGSPWLTDAEKLQQDRQRLVSISQGTDVGTWEWNVQTGETVFNDIWARIVGYTIEELAPVSVKTWETLTHPADLKQARELLKRHFSGELPFYDCEVRMKHKEGHWVWVYERGRVVSWTDDRQPLLMLGTHTDITERKRVAEDLVRAKELAETAHAAKSDILVMMSHEIRTPIYALIGMTNLLLDTPLNREQREFASTTTRCGEAALEIINNILDVSKIEAGRMRLEMNVFELQPLVAGVLESLSSHAREKGLTLAMDIAADVPTRLRSDDLRLRQVLAKLVGNSVKFTERGEIIVRVRDLSSNGPRARLRFEIQDSGVGISAADQARLFQPFTQACPADARKPNGAGLGLTIARRIVELFEGQIGVLSKPGAGTVFWFEIQAEVVKAIEPAQELAEAQPDPKPGRLEIGEQMEVNAETPIPESVAL